MIHTINGKRNLKYNTPLIDYIRKNNLYEDENLIYTTKYTNGTFSITNPTSDYNNCKIINGYPHFTIPIDICLEEIDFFTNVKGMYKNNFIIRYGDTHPHKPIPKLAQVRNLIIENSMSAMIGSNVQSLYCIGDISIKTISHFIEKNCLDIDPEKLFINIVNNRVDNDIKIRLHKYIMQSIIEVKKFLIELNLIQKETIIESELYKNEELYNMFKNNGKYKDELKNNGELKYTLQELMFIYYILNNSYDVLINIIGSNQSEHVKKVNNILNDENTNLDVRFLTYEICKNGDERDITIWSNMLEEYIKNNNFTINNKIINYSDLLKILIITNSNDVILDFSNMKKYGKNIETFCSIVEQSQREMIIDIPKVNNDLICKMALVGYNLNRAIEMGNQNYFFKYILNIVNEYEHNCEKYKNISGLYYSFLRAFLLRIGYNIDNNKVKVMRK